MIVSKFATYQRPLTVLGAIGFVLCWYLSTGVGGSFWYLAWFAPVPLLVIAFNTSPAVTFLIAFLAYLLGRTSYFFYLTGVMPPGPAIIIALLLSLAFAVIILLTRWITKTTNGWYSVFAFPALYTTFELMMMMLSNDGTSSSIAYNQADFLPVIQILAITGIPGVTFFITFVSSALAGCFYFRKSPPDLKYVILSLLTIAGFVFIFGWIRMRQGTGSTVKVGLVVLDEKIHNKAQHPEDKSENAVVSYYSNRIAGLAANGARLVLLPEKTITFDSQASPNILTTLRLAARRNHVFVVVGYINLKGTRQYNAALVIDSEGNIMIDYDKVYLVKGWEDRFEKGKGIGLYKYGQLMVGVAICKDMDFPDFVRNYGRSGVSFMTIPAWDFVADDWLHSRMAIFRGVEGGFSEIRTAREGRLTISDCYGRVTAETSSANDKEANLLGYVSIRRLNTLYNRLGNWFGILCSIVTLLFLFFTVKGSKTTSPSQRNGDGV